MIYLQDLLAATGGSLHGPVFADEFSDFCYDTRLLNPGELFLAVVTDKGDGHDYVLEAARSGAFGELRAQLESLSQQSTLLSAETAQFRTVLKSSQARGKWGEETLRRVVEAGAEVVVVGAQLVVGEDDRLQRLADGDLAGHGNCGGEGPDAHGGIAVDPGQPAIDLGRRVKNEVDVVRVVDPQQLLPGDLGGIVVGDQHFHAGGDHAIGDGIEALRALRMVGAGLVLLAEMVADKGKVHDAFLSPFLRDY